MNGTWKFLVHLFEIGRERADQWLAENYDAIGVKGTVDFQARYL
jgi:NTE family protein